MNPCAHLILFCGNWAFLNLKIQPVHYKKFGSTFNTIFLKRSSMSLPPPGGYVIILVCMYVCAYVCAYVCVYVCLSVNTITQKIINILTSNFAHTFTIA